MALDADLGCSDGGGYHAIVQESEVTGGLAFLVVEHESGGIVMMLAADPWRERFSRQRVADYFGIDLPPLPARNPATGEPITIPWG